MNLGCSKDSISESGTMQIRMLGANPALLFIYNLALLPLAVPSAFAGRRHGGTAFWVAICAALLMVIHDCFNF